MIPMRAGRGKALVSVMVGQDQRRISAPSVDSWCGIRTHFTTSEESPWAWKKTSSSCSRVRALK